MHFCLALHLCQYWRQLREAHSAAPGGRPLSNSRAGESLPRPTDASARRRRPRSKELRRSSAASRTAAVWASWSAPWRRKYIPAQTRATKSKSSKLLSERSVTASKRTAPRLLLRRSEELNASRDKSTVGGVDVRDPQRNPGVSPAVDVRDSTRAREKKEERKTDNHVPGLSVNYFPGRSCSEDLS